MSLKKIGIVAGVMLTVCGSPLWAAYAKIGDYRDVEVVNVTWRGIEVLHRDGGCILKRPLRRGQGDAEKGA